MKINLTMDISQIPLNPETDIDLVPVQQQYFFLSNKDPRLLAEIIKQLEDKKS